MKSKEKPSLDELFQSKKLDVPSDDFWDGFQDRVRDRALTSVVQRSKFSTVSKAIVFSVPASFACLLAVFFYLQSPPSPVQSTEFVQQLDEISMSPADAVFLDDLAGQDVEVVSSHVVDSKLSDQSLYVHHALEWADEDSSFEEHTIKEKEFQQPDLFAQFTF
ncbi:MAG: hypothetical protein HN531_13660 [Opitutae bacterium]|jgi:hypothetical protein|nr:hypothetical protein [Opitutae bacterium]